MAKLVANEGDLHVGRWQARHSHVHVAIAANRGDERQAPTRRSLAASAFEEHDDVRSSKSIYEAAKRVGAAQAVTQQAQQPPIGRSNVVVRVIVEGLGRRGR